MTNTSTNHYHNSRLIGRVYLLSLTLSILSSAQNAELRMDKVELKTYRINAFTVTLPDDTCFQPFGGG